VSALHELSIAQAGAALRNRSLSSLELTQALLERVEALDGELNLFFLITPERARRDARRADAELRAGKDRGPLHGIAYGLKDILATKGIATTCGSRLLLGNVPRLDCGVEAKLRAGGGVLLGKLATSEFACGGPADDLPFPVPKNPWNAAHYTGGSSSGSAGAVAAGLMRAAIGTDTGGSTRVPASYCGVVGLKPTQGLVSSHGLFPLAPSLDHCAPLARSVSDMALVLNVIAGYDARDPASVDRPAEDYTRGLGRGVEGMRLGYARAFLVACKILPELLASLDAAAATLRDLGAIVEEVAIPDFELFRACSKVIVAAEAFTIHEQTLRSRPREYGSLTYARLVAGAGLAAADLIHASEVRRRLTGAIRDVLARYDALITATGWGVAPRLGPMEPGKPPPMVGSPTVIGNLTGLPALSVPIGLSWAGLPLGMQIYGRPFDEARMLRIAAALEEAIGFTDSERGTPPMTRVRAGVGRNGASAEITPVGEAS
jgi:aspartyl-tRNA(Asn)/glutamyl-tRNA(Gln) amidotransferase subunit A